VTVVNEEVKGRCTSERMLRMVADLRH
jgi:hypothetical protein